jgi:putative transposase
MCHFWLAKYKVWCLQKHGFKWECELIEFGGESDHVHLLIETHPSVDLSKLVNNIKTVTSRKLRCEFSQHLKKFYWAEKPQFWSGSYALISVGAQAPLDKINLLAVDVWQDY